MVEDKKEPQLSVEDKARFWDYLCQLREDLEELWGYAQNNDQLDDEDIVILENIKRRWNL